MQEDTGDGDTADGDKNDVEAVLSQIKAHPGNVSLNSLLDEITKLKQVGAVDIPADAFTWTWRGRRRSFWRGRAMAGRRDTRRHGRQQRDTGPSHTPDGFTPWTDSHPPRPVRYWARVLGCR